MNLGYACINMTLSDSKPKITTNRGVIKSTFLNRGINYAGELALLNLIDLISILKWNVENNIQLFRVSSDIFPWVSHYNIQDLPQYKQIIEVLSSTGDYIKENN